MADQVFNMFRQLPFTQLLAGTLVVGFLAANVKCLPLAHTVRLLPSLYRLLRGRWGGKPAPKAAAAPTTTTLPAARPALFRHYTMHTRAVSLDLDINVHKSNSTFFSDADINRAELITSLLSQALGELGSPAFILAGVQCKFHREIRPYQRYAVSSRILTWTDKAMYVVTYFAKPGSKFGNEPELLGGPASLAQDGQKRLFATMVSKYVFKAGRATVAPEHVLRAAHLVVVEDGAKERVVDGQLIRKEDVEATRQTGLNYVKQCME